MAYLIFDWCCPNCGYQEERMCKDGAENICKKCRNPMNRMISSPAMVRTNCADKTGFRRTHRTFITDN